MRCMVFIYCLPFHLFTYRTLCLSVSLDIAIRSKTNTIERVVRQRLLAGNKSSQTLPLGLSFSL